MKDDAAVVFGEDVAFGGVFRCTMVSMPVHHSTTLCSSSEELRVLLKSLVRRFSQSLLQPLTYAGQAETECSIHL
jgi:hypothetical protein